MHHPRPVALATVVTVVLAAIALSYRQPGRRNGVAGSTITVTTSPPSAPTTTSTPMTGLEGPNRSLRLPQPTDLSGDVIAYWLQGLHENCLALDVINTSWGSHLTPTGAHHIARQAAQLELATLTGTGRNRYPAVFQANNAFPPPPPCCPTARILAAGADWLPTDHRWTRALVIYQTSPHSQLQAVTVYFDPTGRPVRPTEAPQPTDIAAHY